MSEEQAPYGDETTAAEEKFERDREDSVRFLSPLTLMWARNRLEVDVAELYWCRNTFFSEEKMARNYLSIALHFQFVDIAEEIKSKFQI